MLNVTPEWKGPHQNPGYDWIPADLRIDHVYPISCKFRLRVHTPWDWRREFDLAEFSVSGDETAQQPKVLWSASVLSREMSTTTSVQGHIEVRWSHGRFGGNPEAKVYLDSPLEQVPGYVPL